MAKDLIVGVVDGYNWDQIKYWANSIDKSGFDGHKALVVYNMDVETANRLTKENFILIGVTPYDEKNGFVAVKTGGNIMVDRFFFIHNFLKMLQDPMEVNRVIITDVRDVVFQVNPTNWLDQYMLPQYNLVVGSENLTYDKEPWGNNNLKKSFGEYFFESLKDHPINCAGVIAGTLEDISDLCLTIWLVCRGLNPHVEGGGGPDQAAMNILLDTVVHKYTTFFTDPTNGWVVHAGTTLDAIKAGSGGIGEAYRRNPSMEIPFINDIEYTVTDSGVCIGNHPITVVHQWDRVPAWKKIVEEKFGD